MKKALFSFIASMSTAISLTATTQAVVFDFGGVMTGEPNREAVVVFLQESLHLTKSQFEKANQEKRLAVKEGKTDEEFWISYADEHAIILPADWGASFKAVMRDAIGINPKMYDLVDELKERNIPVAMLSNIDKRLARLIRDYGLYESFDPCLLSFEIGYAKPDPRAYRVLIAELNFPAQDIVFIDDLPENIASAKKVGIDAIRFLSEDQIRQELIQRGVL